MALFISPRVSTGEGHRLNLYHCAEMAALHPSPLARYETASTFSDSIHILRNPIERHILIDEDGSAHRPGGMVQQIAAMSFDKSSRKWNLKVDAPTAGPVFANGKVVKKTAILKPGDVVSMDQDAIGPGSFGIHVQIPIHPDAPPIESGEFSRQMISKGIEPMPRYSRVIAVMGARIRPDGSLGPILERRVHEAMEEFKKSWEEGIPSVLVFSGGTPDHYLKNPDEQPRNDSGTMLTEGEAMAKAAVKYAHETHMALSVPDVASHLLVEPDAKDTIANAYFVRKLIQSKAYRHLFANPGFGPGLEVQVMVEQDAHTRFKRTFSHVFNGTGVKIMMLKSPSTSISNVNELHKTVVRREFFNETTAGDLDDIAGWLSRNHVFYAGKDKTFFKIEEQKDHSARTDSTVPREETATRGTRSRKRTGAEILEKLRQNFRSTQ